MECPLSADQTVTEGKNDDILIAATVPDSLELRWWLLSFGDDAEVLEPPKLRDWYREVVSANSTPTWTLIPRQAGRQQAAERESRQVEAGRHPGECRLPASTRP